MADTKHKRSNENTSGEPYEAPQILYREPLEAVATACVPAPPSKEDPGSCPMGPISS